MNQAQLYQAVSAYLHSAKLESSYPLFESLTAARVGQIPDLYELRQRIEGTTDVQTGVIPYPADFGMLIGAVVGGNLLVPVSMHDALMVSGSGGAAVGYELAAEGVRTVPAAPGVAYSMDYQSVPAVTADAGATNIIMTKYPGVYLWGMVLEGYRLISDDEGIALAEAAFTAEAERAAAASRAGAIGRGNSVTPRGTVYGKVRG